MKKRRYIEYLKKEIREYFSNHKDTIKTIYFGGGTPSVLSIDEVREILECFPGFDSSQLEISFECNPEDITEEYIWGIFTLGINRISLGVQSLNDETLQAIHRSDRESIFRALENIQSIFRGKQGNGESEGTTLSERRGKQFSDERQQSESEFVDPSGAFGTFQSGKVHSETNISINIDLILGLPFSKPGETLGNIQELHEKFPFITHTSVYMLEDGMYPKDWKQNSMNEEEMKQEYNEICQYFETIGWNHYEISNWAKPGYESIHNRGYWNHTNYRGFGLSATSYRDGKRWENSTSFSHYYRGENSSSETLTSEQIYLEKIIFGIRAFSLDAAIFPKNLLEELIQKGDIKIINEKIILTPAGIFRENTIIAKLIEHF